MLAHDRLEGGVDGAAPGVAHDHDETRPEPLRGELDAADLRRGDDVTRHADDEQIAQPLVEDDLSRRARVRAAEHDRERRLRELATPPVADHRLDAADTLNVAAVPLFETDQRLAGRQDCVLRAHAACIPQADVSIRATFCARRRASKNRPVTGQRGKVFDGRGLRHLGISPLCVACRLLLRFRMTSRNISLPGLAVATLLAGCGHGQLRPAESATTVPGAPDYAASEVDGVRVAAAGTGWDGRPTDLGQRMTPVKVRIVNHSGKPLRVLYEDFVLAGA